MARDHMDSRSAEARENDAFPPAFGAKKKKKKGAKGKAGAAKTGLAGMAKATKKTVPPMFGR